MGDLYEYDRGSKPSWKKHIRKESLTEDASLKLENGVTLHGLSGDQSISIFLLTKVAYVLRLSSFHFLFNCASVLLT